MVLDNTEWCKVLLLTNSAIVWNHKEIVKPCQCNINEKRTSSIAKFFWHAWKCGIIVKFVKTTTVEWCTVLHRKHTYSFSHTSLLSFGCQPPNSSQPSQLHWPTGRPADFRLACLPTLQWMESCTQSFGVRRIFRGLPHYLHYRPWPNIGHFSDRIVRSTAWEVENDPNVRAINLNLRK